MDARTPYIEQTPFDRMEPPAKLTHYFCPACGRSIKGTYNIDPSRKSCTKTWHLTTAECAEYVRRAPGDEASINAAIEALVSVVSDAGGRGNDALSVLKGAVGW